MDLLFSNIITAVCSGSLSWQFTLKWQRREAEASATARVQEIYRNMIADLENDRRQLREQVGELKAEVEDLRRQLQDIKRKYFEFEINNKAYER